MDALGIGSSTPTSTASAPTFEPSVNAYISTTTPSTTPISTSTPPSSNVYVTPMMLGIIIESIWELPI